MNRRASASLLCLTLAVAPRAAQAADAPPKNVIIFVGDGMGFEHVKLAGYWANGTPGGLFFESFPNQGQMTHNNASNAVTDSAASATAMATGVKVNNSVISVRTPGDGADMNTVLEYYKAQGKATGLVTTADIRDATPASFGAHVTTRSNKSGIWSDYMNNSRPTVLFGAAGAAGTNITGTSATTNGYTYISNRTDLNLINKSTVTNVSGQFRTADLLEWEVLRSNGSAPNQPSLTELTLAALDILDNDPDGFFLLVENENIDEVGHGSIASGRGRRETLVWEVRELANAVQAAHAWANGRDDTLIVVTADHETGGLTVTQTGTITPGTIPAATFAGTSHTATPVPIYAWGRGANGVAEVTDNVHIRTLLIPVAPVITTEPSDASVLIGDAVTFSVAATGSPAVSRQWTRNNIDLAGETGATLSFSAALADNGAVYRCRATNDVGSALSRAATLTVSAVPVAPTISGQPADLAVLEGQTVRFETTASGVPAPSYQWDRNDAAIPGATDAVLTFAARRADDGARFQCRVSNGLGTADSRDALLSVSLAPGQLKVLGGARGYTNFQAGEQAAIQFVAESAGGVEIVIYRTSGEIVRTLTQDISAGTVSVRWDGRSDKGELAPAGVYLFHLTAPGLRRTGKITAVD